MTDIKAGSMHTTPARWRIALTLMAGLAFASPAHADSRRVGVTGFERLVVLGDMIVQVVPDRITYAQVEGERDAIDALSLDVQDRTLTISQSVLGRFGPRPTTAAPLTIRLHVPTVRLVALRGTGSIDAHELRGDDVRVELTGQGRINARISNGQSLTMRANGSGTITMAGRSRDVSAYTDGPASIDASALDAGNLTVRSSGSGTSNFKTNGPANVTAIGQASVVVTGRARCTVHNISAGNVRCGDPTDRVAH